MLVKGSPVSSVALIYNESRRSILKLAKRLENLLIGSGIEVKEPKRADIVIVIGGDGTLLRAFHQTMGAIPILGVKDSTYGTLLEVDHDQIDHLPGLLSQGRYWLEEVPTIETKVETRIVALNELLIRSGKTGKSSRLGIAIDKIPVGECICDGVIVSTPTGSLAYSLAAGGPLVDPRAEVMIISYLAPWPPSMTLAVTSFALPLDSEVEVWSPDPRSYIVADGLSPVRMKTPIRISRSDIKAVFVRLSPNPADFYKRITKRMVPRRLIGMLDHLNRNTLPQNL